MAKITKKRKTASELYTHADTYPLNEALELLSKFPKARFDETVELSLHLGVDPKQSTQMVRGIVNLPKGSGKKVRVVAFTDNAQEALDAGADEAGMDDLIAKIMDGWTDFDVAVSTPAAMKEVRKVARVLGPRGLMPNPKSGTVTDDISAAIQSVKSGGRVEFKMDKTANIGIVVGKRSFSVQDLEENITTVFDALGKARPESLKGHSYIKSAAISGTMSPGVRLDSAVYANL
ncbi:50S ribosomal protein L1 [Puniceicoccales bacterium CK1056]|uniref:Large ribosomal subunit protein uL1 n=1 Tax=Oceanipulchritudo coccoides TaxID=2706888 RepID=A0A6B2M3F4_9BACT|nr:50S ribosomal protein L1 [Oceanipulchritudo coccoides]NDV62634.1 50S ribosomal protein L1 [Oceanipulchritudo coccoides]